ncbi:MAG: 2-hydroxyacyl-CoA dehydratase [Candidatus Helarchaeota archaeon]|nr:2-hydroxyacyl-CoA dehydratase [Candidatus Helarchaeota archaeon]
MNSAIVTEAIEVLKQYKEGGTKIVGVVQHGIFPDELVVAAGAIPIRLILGGKDEQEIGDQYLSATTCPYGRATLGFLEEKDPLYSLIDTMILGTFCNGSQNVRNYLDNFNIPSITVSIPHTRGDYALKYYLSELKKVKTYLERLTGTQATPQSFSDAIKAYNQMRKLLRQINNYRKLDTPPVRGMTMQELVWQAFLLGPEVMIPRCKELLQNLADKPLTYSGTRVFLTGSGITLGDTILELIEEQCGGLIVADDLWSSMDYFLEDTTMDGVSPLKALAERYLCRNLCGRMTGEKEIRMPKILELYHAFRASGIIYHTLKFCDSYSNLKPEFKKFMNRHDIPLLDLDRDYAESSTGQIKTRVEAFLEMIS